MMEKVENNHWSFYDSVEQQHIFYIKTIARKVGISYNTGASAIKLFTRMRIAQRVNQTERYPVMPAQAFRSALHIRIYC